MSQPITDQQHPTQGPDPESVNVNRETPTTSKAPEYVKVTQYLKMILDKPGKIQSVLAHVFMWITLAGFLVLPTTFPQIEITVNTVQFTRNIGV
jgi:hypothetical protein